ncbi:hypothetical protein KM043_014086 [Ampulex compressa]|nr:hypothetical protein KM043_014086 [Ampulex compressa]
MIVLRLRSHAFWHLSVHSSESFLPLLSRFHHKDTDDMSIPAVKGVLYDDTADYSFKNLEARVQYRIGQRNAAIADPEDYLISRNHIAQK